MGAKTILTGTTARDQLLKGAHQLARVVGVTYGPHGRTCMLDRLAGLLATKDGVTVAREIELSGRTQNLGAQILKEACLRVNAQVGDGTTTVALLADGVLQEGHKLITAGMSPNGIIRGVRAAAVEAQDCLEKLHRPIQEKDVLKQVALLASNGDTEIAENLAEACMAVGKDGTVAIEDSQSVETWLDLKEGMELDGGMANTELLGTNQTERLIDGAIVAVLGISLVTVEDVQDLLETASQWPRNELVVFAEAFVGEALTTMTINNSKGVVKCSAVPVSGVGPIRIELLKDIAALTGATFVDPRAGMNHRTWDQTWFGTARKITIKARTTVIEAYDEAQETVQERLAQLRAEEERVTSDYDKDRLRERKAKLSGGLAILRVGGVSEVAMKERRARVEDALGSVQAALRSGILPGGGVAYLRAALHLETCPPSIQEPEERAGWLILAKALKIPATRLIANAGGGVEIIGKLSQTQGWIGWEATSEGGCVRDMGETPILPDPFQVVQVVIETAVSTATILLTAETTVTQRLRSVG